MPEVDSSQVILFDLQGKMQEPTRVASVQLKGIIIPDLLYFQVDNVNVCLYGTGTGHHNEITDAELYPVFYRRICLRVWW